MKPPKTKKTRRRCLKCSRSFWSEGPWNRLCARCNAANRRMPDLPSSSPLWNGEPMHQRAGPL